MSSKSFGDHKKTPGALPGKGAGKKPARPTPPDWPASPPAPTGPLADAVAQGGTSQGAPAENHASGRTATPQNLHIPGSGDRMHHLSMAHSHAKTVFQLPQLAAKKHVEGVKATSRADCARRRGNKFCDPAHPSGCGGRFCGQQARTSLDAI
ncbi:hypothetical protein D3870_17090 [Noviherbaspirillum cavernae]|uniref:Uncharacterized protein n=1 Tax=Noviherbaspirillum cavernae TaxID=2320862 RepID=A0A418X514_9BURK|nr:hypothetical protein [Noviherbaspirillum cavernae]RJG07481.1 hypothetical protein D3870_17090 [Noviherbaspirillum cavernae]